MSPTSLRVLLVEDDPDDRVLVRRFLEQELGRESLHLETTVSPEEARRVLEEGDFDVALVDYRLEAESGLDLVQWIRESDRGTATVVLTGQGDEEVAADAMRAGADDYLSKAGLSARGLADSVRRARKLARVRAERREAREALARSEARYRTIVETAHEGVWIVDEERRTSFANARMAEMLGVSREELLESPLGRFVDEDDRERALRKLDRRGEGVPEQYELPLRRADGARIWTLISATPLYDEAGRYTGSLGMVSDLTEHRKLEEQVREAQRLDAVGRLAGGVAHDFNNVLSVIIGYGEMLLQDLSGAKRREQVEHVLEAAGRAERLVQRLLAFGRKQVVRPRATDLGALVEEMEELIHRLVGERIELRLHRADSAGPVLADRGQVEQMVVNLVTNARDAMPEGGKLTLEIGTVHLGPEYCRDHPEVEPGHYVLLAVSDTGEGMDEETRNHAFDPFFSTKEVGKGTGLGLSTVHGIVRQSGGHVRIYSEPGLGSTVKIYLPRIEEPVETAEPPEAEPPVQGGTERILVVEDEEMVRHLVRDTLEAYGYEVLETEDPEAAVAQAASGVDLLVTDVVMPGLNGPELVSRIRADRPELPVLYMSGYSDEAVVHHGVTPSSTDFLAKPFSPGTLARKVRAMLSPDADEEAAT